MKKTVKKKNPIKEFKSKLIRKCILFGTGIAVIAGGSIFLYKKFVEKKSDNHCEFDDFDDFTDFDISKENSDESARKDTDREQAQTTVTEEEKKALEEVIEELDVEEQAESEDEISEK